MKKEDTPMTNIAYAEPNTWFNEFSDDDPITKDYYDRRVADWHERIDTLFNQIIEWLPHDFSYEFSETGAKPDNLMKKHEPEKRVKPLKTLIIRHNDLEIARIYPRYLWVLGNNGEVAFKAKNIYYSIIDRAEKKKYSFNKPEWNIKNSYKINGDVKFNQNIFMTTLNEMQKNAGY
jgi:hypothetical protein